MPETQEAITETSTPTSSRVRPLQVKTVPTIASPVLASTDSSANSASSSPVHDSPKLRRASDPPDTLKPLKNSHRLSGPTTKSYDRRHSFIPSSLPVAEVVQLRRLGQRRYSSARRDDSLTQLLAGASKSSEPSVTCWLTRSWVTRQRRKAVFFRGLFLGCLLGICVRLLIGLWRLLVSKR